MKSFESTYLDRLSIPNRLFSMIHRIGEHKGREELYRQQAPEVLENLRQVGIIQSTESSNRLEGITVDPRRLRDLMAMKTTPKSRSESEVAGYRDVLNTIHQNYAHILFTENVVLQLHRDLMRYAGKEGGRWKSVPNTIIEKNPDGSAFVRFQPVAPHQTSDFMRILHQEYHTALSKEEWNPLLLTAFYILDFLCVHPFLDGNGRMARLLTVLGLYHHGYQVGRFISIERIIEDSRESYYDTLFRSSQGWHEGRHDVWAWTEYFLGTILSAYGEFEQRVGTITSGAGSKTAMILAAINGFIGEFSISELEQSCPTVSRDMIRHVLFNQREQGKIEVLGRGRGAKWRKLG